ncbi:acyltransferase family protein [Flavobacterium sp. TSSA_36]|uniref:acyltransferase family protein n=1 Tax=Flavobacterium sp. TSSA_36 TaxID=3447669 RepID=UPI003F2E74A8
MKSNFSSTTKNHYEILDALRGIAALMVVAFHIMEAHATSRLDQIINHGYLAVDFFFLLSGFVISFAYDDRWSTMRVKDFFKIRLIRLQPMVIMGMLVGAICFYFQDSSLWPLIHQVPFWKLILVMIIGFTLLPLLPTMDIRGWQEMHPLNGPGWSLFFEYVANILYALWVRKWSNTALSILVFFSGCFLIHMAITSPNGDIIGGWSLTSEQLHIGFARLFFPFFGGLLLHRIIKLTSIKNAFFWSATLLIVILAMPRVGEKTALWQNGLYDALSVIFIFPIILYIGASGGIQKLRTKKLCKFLGAISYPIYITHYPLIYIYTAWVVTTKSPLCEAFPFSILTFIASILLGYACLKWYDEPVGNWLKTKLS